MPTAGLIGIGAMGMPMARSLLRRGFAVQGFDLRPATLQALEAHGGVAAISARDAAAGADALLLMVVDAKQAEEALFEGGALDALPPHGVVVLTATCPPAAVQAIASQVIAAGRRFLDAPVSGGTAGAAAGTLTIMAAGPAGTLAAMRPMLDALGDKVFHVGEHPGQGAAMKAVNQLLCGVHIAAAAEAFSMAARLGIDGQAALDILSGSAASSWMLRDRGPRMLQADPVVSSAVSIFVKDLGIVLQAGRDEGIGLPLAAAAHQLFLATAGRGDGAADDSQVLRTYAALNGTRSMSG